MGGKSKHKPAPPSPRRKETPRSTPELPGASDSGDRLCWRFKHYDHDSPWPLTVPGPDGDGPRGLIRRLAKLEAMTITEVFRGYPGKEYDIEEIPTQLARDRLDVIGLADMTKISVVRLGGEERVYGFRCGNVFHVVWWDPGHEIWPSKLRRT